MRPLALSWQGTLALVKNTPNLTGTITIPSIDMDELKSNESGASHAGAPTLQKTGHWSDERIDLSGLKKCEC